MCRKASGVSRIIIAYAQKSKRHWQIIITYTQKINWPKGIFDFQAMDTEKKAFASYGRRTENFGYSEFASLLFEKR
jgi:hypothetical protein